MSTSPSPSSRRPTPSAVGYGFALAGLILAGIGVLASLGALLFGQGAIVVALVTAVAGLVLSALGARSTAGRTLGIIGVVLSGAVLVVWVLLLLLLTPFTRVQSHQYSGS